jgi:hypothetical protein
LVRVVWNRSIAVVRNVFFLSRCLCCRTLLASTCFLSPIFIANKRFLATPPRAFAKPHGMVNLRRSQGFWDWLTKETTMGSLHPQHKKRWKQKGTGWGVKEGVRQKFPCEASELYCGMLSSHFFIPLWWLVFCTQLEDTIGGAIVSWEFAFAVWMDGICERRLSNRSCGATKFQQMPTIGR